jgi:Asp-tRNA(Asn)/Glu-tRNA(Gln) amidotransferase A subunit family amidase
LPGAFVTLTLERALDAGRAAQKRLVGRDGLPPLLGVPTAIKDLALTAGVAHRVRLPRGPVGGDPIGMSV